MSDMLREACVAIAYSIGTWQASGNHMVITGLDREAGYSSYTYKVLKCIELRGNRIWLTF